MHVVSSPQLTESISDVTGSTMNWKHRGRIILVNCSSFVLVSIKETGHEKTIVKD